MRGALRTYIAASFYENKRRITPEVDGDGDDMGAGVDFEIPDLLAQKVIGSFLPPHELTLTQGWVHLHDSQKLVPIHRACEWDEM